MTRWTLGMFAGGLLVLAAARVGAQFDQAAPGTLFIHARDGARRVTVSRRGTVVATLTFPKGTLLSAVDEHRSPVHRSDGGVEFHGTFELRAMSPSDVPRPQPRSGAELLSHAPVAFSAEGVDVLLETVAER